MSASRRDGLSLVELIVALVLLELTGIVALTAILTSEQLGRHASAVSRDDVMRWQEYRHAELSPSCGDSGVARAEAVALPASERPPLEATILCGR